MSVNSLGIPLPSLLLEMAGSAADNATTWWGAIAMWLQRYVTREILMTSQLHDVISFYGNPFILTARVAYLSEFIAQI